MAKDFDVPAPGAYSYRMRDSDINSGSRVARAFYGSRHMIALRNQPDHLGEWRTRMKDEAYRKVLASPLMHACAEGGNYPRALFGGFWHFVDEFPAIIRETYTALPSAAAKDTVRRFLRRLQGMEDDERAHRALWIRSASRVGLSEGQLHQWRVLPEIRSLTQSIRTEKHLGRRLLYFVAVEIVAQGVARYLFQAPRFVEAMGEEGMEWFAAHLAAPGHATTHEAVAYKLALAVKQAADEPIDEKSINDDIQRCVDWFFAGGVACGSGPNRGNHAGVLTTAGSRPPLSPLLPTVRRA